MIRTHTCGQLNINNLNEEVTLCGWVHSRRDHGKLIFIDIRDRFGITQIVFNPRDNAEVYKIATELKNEYVVLVKGKVNKRPQGTENPKIPTGQIELIALGLKILNPSELTPFEIDDTIDVSEELRLEYRYLDMRRPKIMNNLILRHRLCKLMRNFLDSENFIEIETPILTKSTPEGARDYLVPSRLNLGSFYALPQSPQLFKQILMVSGLDRYFQIAKCFRDEDLRADRQPEFTQLDIEMSFINEDDIFSLCERLVQKIFREIKNLELTIPFSRMTYQEAMKKFNSDKPDLRKKQDEFSFVWIIDFPLFKFNAEEKRWESEHHPFTSPNEEDLSFLKNKDLGMVRARSYDLVLNGVEIASGSIRIHQQEIQKKIFEIIGLSDEDIEERFGFLLKSFKFGAPPHGGIAFGLDRLVAILNGVDSIREVIAFPKNQRAVCPLTNAPSQVKDKQLKELEIIVSKRRGKMRRGILNALLILILSLGSTGCLIRTYTVTKDRLDQDISGNRGYIQGTTPSVETQAKPKTRETVVVEVEVGSPIKFGKPKSLKQKTQDQDLSGNLGYLRGSQESKQEEVTQGAQLKEITAAETPQSFVQYKVERGDTLQKISKKFYGSYNKWQKIYNANKSKIKDPNKITYGQVLDIPQE